MYYLVVFVDDTKDVALVKSTNLHKIEEINIEMEETMVGLDLIFEMLDKENRSKCECKELGPKIYFPYVQFS